MSQCSYEDCSSSARIAGYCPLHYHRGWRSARGWRPAEPKQLIDRLYERSQIIGECWEWCGTRFPAGYGSIKVGGRRGLNRSVHRVSWELHNGPIPEGMFICHRCDNPPCWRPEHLFLGSVQENHADMVAKNRQRGAVGERNAKAKLTRQDVAEIRRLYVRQSREFGTVALAERFGVSNVLIGKIVRGELWNGEFDLVEGAE